MKSGDIVIKEAIGIGDNEVDALNDAKKQLGLDENAEVDFEISAEDMEMLKNFKEIADYGESSGFPVYGGKLSDEKTIYYLSYDDFH